MNNLLLIISVLVCFDTIIANPYPLLDKPDSIEWNFPLKDRLLAIGDLHGDPDAFIDIAIHAGLVDSKSGSWKAKNTHLVLMGDLFDRGMNSRFLLDYVYELQKQAAKLDSQIHILLGNHELMLISGDMRHVNPLDAYDYSSELQEFNTEDEVIGLLQRDIGHGIKDFFNTKLDDQEKSTKIQLAVGGLETRLETSMIKVLNNSKYPYASELRNRNTIIKIGRTLFIHAGFEEWLLPVAAQKKISHLNTTVRSEIKKWQDLHNGVVEHTPNLHWLFDAMGPVWTRELAKERLSSMLLNNILKAADVDDVVIGHSITIDNEVQSIYDGKVFKIDTAISKAYGGNLSAIEFTSDRVVFYNDVQRTEGIHPVRKERLPKYIKRWGVPYFDKTFKIPFLNMCHELIMQAKYL